MATPFDKAAFRALALRVLQAQFPQMSVSLPDDPDFVVCAGFPGHADVVSIEAYLGNVRTRCAGQSAADQESYLQAFWQQMVASLGSAVAPSWPQVQAHLRFLLVTKPSLVHPTRGDTSSQYYSRPVVADLLQVLVIDQDTTIAYVRPDQPAKWGIPARRLWATALRNLAHATGPAEVETFATAGGTIYSPRWADGYTASRLLLPTMQAQIRAWVGGAAYVAIPDRDRLVAWACRYPATMQRQAMELVAHMYEHGDQPLCPDIFHIKRVPVQNFAVIPRDRFSRN